FRLQAAFSLSLPPEGGTTNVNDPRVAANHPARGAKKTAGLQDALEAGGSIRGTALIGTELGY
ncbi:MAG: hypothetical protein U1E05_12130, partial [Patescibacteria group bacterium]|nr:hypothetical protein [Patescibacteria group bacterium]